MKPIYLLFLSSFSFYPVLAQNQPYYELPKERTFTNGQITLPNLKTEKIFWYLNTQGGIKFQKASFSNNFDGKLTSNNINTFYWEGSIGINKNDKWQLELGYIHDPLAIDWRLLDNKLREIPIAFSVDRLEHVISVRFKKRLATLDKITKKTRLNMLGGIQYSPWRTNKTLSEFDFKIPPNFRQITLPDTLYINGSLNQKASPLAVELGFELISRPFESIEIGVFTKYVISAKGVLNSTFSISQRQGPTTNSELLLNSGKIYLGVTFRWNFLQAIKYLPEIKEN